MSEMMPEDPPEPAPEEITFTGFAVVLPRSAGNGDGPDGN